MSARVGSSAASPSVWPDVGEKRPIFSKFAQKVSTSV